MEKVYCFGEKAFGSREEVFELGEKTFSMKMAIIAASESPIVLGIVLGGTPVSEDESPENQGASHV